MRVIIDIEANGLENATKVWLVVCKDIDTGQLYVFREPSTNEEERRRLLRFLCDCDLVVGHNYVGYDGPVLDKLLDIKFDVSKCIDTLIISKLVNYSRDGHSIKDYGIEFGLHKGDFTDFSKYSPEMETYCVRDVEITERIFQRYAHIINDHAWQPSIRLEHEFEIIVGALHNNGFGFNTDAANKLLGKVASELARLDEKILKEFPPKLKLIREVHPKVTKHGTLSKQDFRFVKDGDLSAFNGGPFSRCEWVPFNPASHKQLIEILHSAGWKPVDKTKTRIDLERELQRARFKNSNLTQVDIEAISAKLLILDKFGYKINENNLATLPSSAPPPARTLASRILLESRRRTLTEWLALVNANTGRIHGNFYGLGAWTHRMSHQRPNTANIPGEFKLDGSIKLYGKEMRSLWCAPPKRLLVGVDAEGIQLRIFAHYIDDFEFTKSLVEGKKDDKTDPHSLNQRILGRVCKSRAAAKRFIYALLLGAGIGKLTEILECSRDETQAALDRLLERYSGFATLKQERLPQDGKRGYFIGLDGRRVPIPGDTAGSRTHLAMSGYLQNGEIIVVKRWVLKAEPRIKLIDPTSKIVNLVHDEKINECAEDWDKAIRIAKVSADSLKEVGEDLGLKCPLAGSFWNDETKDFTIGKTWYNTH